MSAADLTAVLVAEIELCEQRAPEFKAQGSAHVTKFRTDARMKEMERQAEYQKVLPEARALVLERLKLQDLPTLCRNTLDRIKR